MVMQLQLMSYTNNHQQSPTCALTTRYHQEGGLREGHFLLNGKALSLDLPLQDQGVQEPMPLKNWKAPGYQDIPAFATELQIASDISSRSYLNRYFSLQ